MPVEARSYVTRTSDRSLQETVQSQGFVWVKGDFQSGKTSLLYRHQVWLPSDWFAVYADMGMLDRTTRSNFIRDYCDEIAEAIGMRPHTRAFNWRAVRRVLGEHRLAFLVDELGACTNPQIKWLVEAFGSLSQSVPGRVKVVVALKDGPDPLLSNCGIANPKHRAIWSVVSLKPFSQDEIDPLFGLFPGPIADLLRTNMAALQEKTAWRPQTTQLLLDDLWRDLCAPDGHFHPSNLLIGDWLEAWADHPLTVL
jgi:hypothetical protein